MVPPVPFAVTTLSPDAGYYEVNFTCPKNSEKLRFTWTPAPNGTGWGEAAISWSETRMVRLRMQATAPAEQITAKLECRTAGGRVKQIFGPVVLTSGNALLPAPPVDTGLGRRIVYSLSAQQLWAYNADGSLARTYLVSGRRVLLYSRSKQLGSFKVFSKAKMGCIFPIRCPFMVRFNRTALGNIGFHAIPYSKEKGFWQTPAELGQPRSGGCVRAAPEDAQWLHGWAVRGDPVVVIE